MNGIVQIDLDLGLLIPGWDDIRLTIPLWKTECNGVIIIELPCFFINNQNFVFVRSIIFRSRKICPWRITRFLINVYNIYSFRINILTKPIYNAFRLVNLFHRKQEYVKHFSSSVLLLFWQFCIVILNIFSFFFPAQTRTPQV